MSFFRFVSWLRQCCYPAAFRIQPPASKGKSLLLLGLEKLLRPAEGGNPPPPPPSPLPTPPPPAVPASLEKLAVGLADAQFRIRRALKKAKNGDNEATLLPVDRAVQNLEQQLKGNGIDGRDLTGEGADARRNDFEQIGNPREDPSLTRPTILQVECPAVFLNGVLIRPARGIAGKPASSGKDS